MLFWLLSVVLLIAGYPVFLNIAKNALFAYLCVNKPVPNGQVLIVEGWLFDGLLPDVTQEFKNNNYDYILVSWQPRGIGPNDGGHVARKLLALGIDSSRIKIAKVHPEVEHNTLAMALGVKKWLSENDPAVTRVNICTAGAHGKKTWVAYKRALGKSFTVGIFSYTRNRIPVSRWWKESSGGLRYIMLRWIGAIDAAWWPLSWVGN